MTGRTLQRDIFNMPIKRKGQINGKAKGNKNELKCAEAVTVWTGAKFTRTPSSGGLRWQNSQGVAADLVCEDPDFYFPFSIETKHLKGYKDTDILNIWTQARNDAIRAERIPMLFLRKNDDKKVKHYNHSFVNYLVLLDVRYVGMLMSFQLKPRMTVHCDKRNYTLYGFSLLDIIALVDYKKLAYSIKRGNFVAKFIQNEKSDA